MSLCSFDCEEDVNGVPSSDPPFLLIPTSLAYQMGMEGIAGMQLSKSAKDRLKNLQKSKEQVRGERDAVYGLKSIDSTDEESDEEGSSSSGGEENEDVDGAEQ